MPCGRMQHTAALPRGKSCLAYAANAIASTFFADLFSGYQNCGTRSANLVWFFFKWLIPFWNPLFIKCRTASFDGTDNLPIEFLGHAASNGMPTQHPHILVAWRNFCRTLPLCAARHSVDVPLHFQKGDASAPPLWQVPIRK